MARFQVVQCIKTENAFVIRGILLEGQINEGMIIHVSLNKSLQITGEISEIKKIHNHYEIGIRCSDFEEMDFWEILNLKDDVIEIKSHD